MATSTRTFKVILYGDYGVGKSSVFRRFVDNSFTTQAGPSSTIGLDHYAQKYTAFGETIKLHLWDTAGIERFATLSSSYFQGAHAALLCYSIADRQSFSALSQCLLDVVVHAASVRIYLCGNKTDLETTGDDDDGDGDGDGGVSTEDVDQFRLQCDAVLNGTYRISCKTGEGLQEMFHSIADDLSKVVVPNFNRIKLPHRHVELEEDEQNSRCCS